MGIAMMRTSYSPMFNEALDFSCVVFDGRAEMIAQAPFMPGADRLDRPRRFRLRSPRSGRRTSIRAT